MLSIILIGANGKMGNAVSDVVDNRSDCKIVLGIDKCTESRYNFLIKENFIDTKADVIIDFSNPSTLDNILDFAIKNTIPVVLATTGYSDKQLEKIKEASKIIPVFFTANMSIGINLLINLCREACSVLGKNFDIEIIEKHHNNKVDAPSGTAIMLASAINEASGNYYEYIFNRHNRHEKRSKNELGMHSVRGGSIVGEHQVIYAGEDEIINISHTVTSKKVFAIGAINAAFFIKNKRTGIYDMNDLISKRLTK